MLLKSAQQFSISYMLKDGRINEVLRSVPTAPKDKQYRSDDYNINT
jgi:hypothetical protein